MKNKTISNIRVCFVSPKAYPIFNPDVESVFGGAEVDLYLIAAELAKDDRFDVRFVVGDYGQPKTDRREGVTLIKSVNPHKNMILQGAKIWKALREADSDVYMHEACSLGTTLIAFFCRIHKRGFVYRTASSLEASGECFYKRPLRKPLVQWAFRKADTFIVQNQQDVENAKKTIHREAVVIRNACRIQPDETIEKSGVLWVGRSSHVKRPDLFLALAKALPEIRFVMVCQQTLEDANYTNLLEAARRLENMTFIKRVPFQEIDRYFGQSLVSVNTSDSEGFPNTFVQSCKAGTAILSLNVNPDGFLDRHRCGFCAGGDWNLFVATLKEWIDSGCAKQFGHNGKAYIKDNHDINRIIENYKKIFLNAASRP